MDVFEKLRILTAAAKYDVACTSSGVDRKAGKGQIGSAAACGICHSFASDGRCISLLKVLMTNYCVYDCKYCVNRTSNDVKRTAFSPRELAELTIQFYKRNYIEGLFLSSGVIKNADHTMEQMIRTLNLLRSEYRFNGYIHVKTIPGASSELVERLGMLADRMSVNIELPSSKSLSLLAPDKTKQSVLIPMNYIRERKEENTKELTIYKKAPKFVPAGQSTQMIVGASPETDFQILNLTEGLYKKYKLKRVFYSAYVPVSENPALPSLDTKPPLLREHRLYQADWLLRFYNFKASEILDESHQTFNPFIDPKCNWALHNPEFFPIEVTKASYEELLRVPGIGVKSARRIISIRRGCPLSYESLKNIGVVLKRARYFITCAGKIYPGLKLKDDEIMYALMSEKELRMYKQSYFLNDGSKQLSLFETPEILNEDLTKCITGQM